MPLYYWQGIDTHGISQKGQLEATNAHQAQVSLLHNGIAILEIKEAWLNNFYLSQLFVRNPSSYDLHIFFTQLAAFVQAGIPLKQALQTACSLQHRTNLLIKTRIVIIALEEGKPFHTALQAIPYLPLYAQDLIQASEETGKLDQALESIAQMMLADHTYQTALRNACNGPIITLSTAAIITTGTVVFLMPQLGKLYQQAHLPLPKIVHWSAIAGKAFTPQYLLIMTIGMIALILIFKKTKQTWSMAHLAAQLPILKNTFINTDVLRWVSIMHAYTCNGIPLIDACKAAQSQAISHTVKVLIANCYNALIKGHSLSNMLASSRLPAVLFIKPLLLVGEESGNLTPMLAKAKLDLTIIIEQQTSRFASLVGPIFTVIIGLMIGGLLVMLYVPIMQLGTLIK